VELEPQQPELEPFEPQSKHALDSESPVQVAMPDVIEEQDDPDLDSFQRSPVPDGSLPPSKSRATVSKAPPAHAGQRGKMLKPAAPKKFVRPKIEVEEPPKFKPKEKVERVLQVPKTIGFGRTQSTVKAPAKSFQFAEPEPKKILRAGGRREKKEKSRKSRRAQMQGVQQSQQSPARAKDAKHGRPMQTSKNGAKRKRKRRSTLHPSKPSVGLGIGGESVEDEEDDWSSGSESWDSGDSGEDTVEEVEEEEEEEEEDDILGLLADRKSALLSELHQSQDAMARYATPVAPHYPIAPPLLLWTLPAVSTCIVLTGGAIMFVPATAARPC
jgi:hypothetical protein